MDLSKAWCTLFWNEKAKERQWGYVKGKSEIRSASPNKDKKNGGLLPLYFFWHQLLIHNNRISCIRWGRGASGTLAPLPPAVTQEYSYAADGSHGAVGEGWRGLASCSRSPVLLTAGATPSTVSRGRWGRRCAILCNTCNWNGLPALLLSWNNLRNK